MKSQGRHLSQRRFFVREAKPLIAGQTLILGAEKRNHVRNVLRLPDGSPLQVTSGNGDLFSAILEYSDNGARVQVAEQLLTSPKEDLPELWVGLPKNSTMDWIVEKATECGVAKIVPIVCSRSVVRPESSELSKYLSRWQSIIDHAVEQSETLWAPDISAPLTWDSHTRIVETKPGEELRSRCFAFVSETRVDSDTRAIGASVRELARALKFNIQRPIVLFIGPEGGFAPNERDWIEAHLGAGLSFGKRVLRVETAAIAALTLFAASRDCADWLNLG
jgi:16S rRNA (uracil1498-N3)-methyltransferase